MLWTLKDLLMFVNNNRTLIEGKWVPSRPVVPNIKVRLRNAIKVIRGEVDVVKWPSDQ